MPDRRALDGEGGYGERMDARIDLDAVAEFVTAAREFDWTWGLADIERLCAAQGWSPVEVTRPGVVARTAAAVNRPEARFTFFGSRVGMVTVNVTDSFEPDALGVAEFVAQAYATVAEDLGEPTRRSDGEYPELVWEVTPVAFVHVSALHGSVKLRCVSAEYQRFNDDMRAAASQ
ncbi:DUF6301 family protein [Nocardia sp. 2YAB30]|uniref:DUF6301 family protein n=1 Tax=unclassified Nocardia TaxID=2637762 RepID=UPI003F9BA912